MEGKIDERKMKTDLNFEHDSTKKLLSQLDFEFFLNQIIEMEKYEQNKVEIIYSSYNQNLKRVKKKGKRKQKTI
jgi:hypothetical protein